MMRFWGEHESDAYSKCREKAMVVNVLACLDKLAVRTFNDLVDTLDE